MPFVVQNDAAGSPSASGIGKGVERAVAAGESDGAGDRTLWMPPEAVFRFLGH